MQSITSRSSTSLTRSYKYLSTRATAVRTLSSTQVAPPSHLNSRPINNSKPAYRMASTVASTVQATASAAHSALASLASAAPIKAGDAVPNVEIKLNNMQDKVNFSTLPGKNILVTVPAAFSPTCTSQVPGYVERYAEFKAKGVNGIYVVSVNDMFVMQAWRDKMVKDEGKETQVQFAGDDSGKFASALGLMFDGQAFFGGPRLQRASIIIDSGKVVDVAVEKSPGDLTVSHADEVIKKL